MAVSACSLADTKIATITLCPRNMLAIVACIAQPTPVSRAAMANVREALARARGGSRNRSPCIARSPPSGAAWAIVAGSATLAGIVRLSLRGHEHLKHRDESDRARLPWRL